LKDNPSVADAIEHAIRSNAGLVADAMMAAGGGGEASTEE
jgi:hypothetical protein